MLGILSDCAEAIAGRFLPITWPFRWKRKIAEQQRDRQLQREDEEYIAKIRREGWRSWMVPPYQNYIVEVWRRDWPTVHVIEPHKAPPEMNVAGLLWRPCRSEVLHGTVIIEE